MNIPNNPSGLFNSNDVFELLLLGTLYLFKSSFQTSYEHHLSQLKAMESTEVFTPDSLLCKTPQNLKTLLKSPIILEGVVHCDEPIEYKEKEKDPSVIPLKPQNLISLYKLKAPIFFSLWDFSSEDYYKEANTSLDFSNRSSDRKVRQVKQFWLIDNHNPKSKALIFNNKSPDDALAIDFLDFRKKYKPFSFRVFLNLDEYGHMTKKLGIRCGVFMNVMGEFSVKGGVLNCLKPTKYFRSKDQLVKIMKEEMETPQMMSDLASFFYYGALGIWVVKKAKEFVSISLRNN